MITLNYNLGIGAILTIMPTTFGISFQISYTLLKEPREKSDEHERKKTSTDQEKKVSMFRNSKKVLGRSSLLLKGHLEHLKEEGDKYHANNRIPMEINNITRHSSILSSIGNETEKEKIEPIIKEGNKYGEFTTTDEFLKFNKEIRKWADNANSIQIDIS